MKRRRYQESEMVACKPRAGVEFMGVVIAVCEHEGRLHLVRVFPDGSAKTLAELDTAGTSPSHYRSMLGHAVEEAYELLMNEAHFERRGPQAPFEELFGDASVPYRGHRN
jgi:hypothetical protein